MTFSFQDLGSEVGDPLADDNPERAALRQTLRHLLEDCSPPDRIRSLDDTETFDAGLHSALADLGVLGIGAPAAAGGIGDVRDQIAVVEELAAGPTSMAAFLVLQYMAIQVLGGYGDAAQLEVLERLVAGRAKVSFALSEPNGGTDVARAMVTAADRTADGFSIRGQKIWISAASIADYLIVLARTAPWERTPVEGVSMFLVPISTPGISVRDIDTFGLHSIPTCEVFFDDVEVPTSAVIGELHQGFRQAFATLNRERLNAAAACIGVGRAALDYAVGYAQEREAFGRPIGAFQTLQHRLVDGALALEAARSLTVRAAAVEAAGGRADILSTMAKVAASDAATAITDTGMRLLAGIGFSREAPMERWFRDVRLWTFAPASDEMSRNYLGERLLGLPRSY